MRTVDERAIKAHADLRFRSEYDYALFEYYRSAKVIAFLERAGMIRLFTDVQYELLTNRLEDEGIDLDKDYNDLTDQEYWRIRNALIRHSADYKDLSPAPPYAYAENEYKVVSGIQSVLQRSLYQDLSVGGKLLVIIIWIACFFVPAWLSLPIRFF